MVTWSLVKGGTIIPTTIPYRTRPLDKFFILRTTKHVIPDQSTISGSHLKVNNDTSQVRVKR
uniref:Uncharacterized protein n=1 Tax=Utricularia reniformis TaxID=192314 RepID=A0A1Y0B3I3_9LAMI|nr:hypothetical protein AEK19_MT1799 [Utricularia reniformis]ART31971.1 hypothetical protein AEK19_MT1799 [Utricularia reniformis]